MIRKLKYIMIIFLFAMNANATVHTLNNNNPSPGQFTTWTSVQSASNPGDSIYISGSARSYGNIIVNVYDLTLIGTGYNPQKQNPLVSKLDTIEFSVGKININGIKAEYIIQSNPFGVTEVNIENCLLSIKIKEAHYDSYYKVRNCILYQYDSNFSIDANSTNTYSNPSFIFDLQNNLIFGSISVAGIVYGTDQATVKNSVFSNNVFLRRGDASGGSSGSSFNQPFIGEIDFSNLTFSNNILVDYNGFHNGATFSNTVSLNNCISLSGSVNFTSLPNDNGTTIKNNPAFINGCNSLCAFNSNMDFHLQQSSPAHNAGTDGTDIGVYGGPYGRDFNMYGEPPIPQVRQMNAPSTVIGGSNFSINVFSTVK